MHPVYEVRDLTKTYKQGEVRANDELRFDIHQGEIFGLLGPNGAGKTTLVRQLVGLLRPTSGTIRLFGEDVTRSAGAIPYRVSYLAQRAGVLENVPAEVAVALTGHTRGLSRPESDRQARDLLDLFGLGEVRRKPIRYLSGGQQRLVALAIALIGDLPVLVLDEPTNELDPENRRFIWDLLLERNRVAGTTIILVTHNVLEAERVIRRVGIINHGRIMALGTVGELKARVDRRVRVELRLRENGAEAPAPQVSLDGWETIALGRGHYALLVPAERLHDVIGHVLAKVGLHRLDDFRILTPTLEDVYLQLGGGKDLDEQESA